MLCEISLWGNFFYTWMTLVGLSLVVISVLSGSLLYLYYVNPTFEQWQYKSNPQYPSPLKVREEIIAVCKGLLSATFCPSLALYLAQHGMSQAYCGTTDGKTEYGVGYHVFSFFVVWIGVDLFEFFYHRMGHTTETFWNVHKSHHRFYNPSPFAVIADDWFDQLARALPLLVFPIIMPINMDLIFLEFALLFYVFGVYLHWGYEFDWLDAHNPYINSAFQHYCHHAVSVRNKPYHTGFFFKIWDQLAGSVYDKECFCVKCERKAGKRSYELWLQVEKPDYSVLLKPSFWWSPTIPQKKIE